MVIPFPPPPKREPIERRRPNNPRRRFNAIDWALVAVIFSPYYIGALIAWRFA